MKKNISRIKRKDKIEIFNNMIHIEGENILNELNGETIYLGITDFDKDGVIKENLERSSWWKNMGSINEILISVAFTVLIIIVSILFTILPIFTLIKTISGPIKKRIKEIVSVGNRYKVKLIDLIIVDNNRAFSILPVLKDEWSGKIYIPAPKRNYGCLMISYIHPINSTPTIKIKNLNKELVEIGQEGTLYAEAELSIVSTNNAIITMNNQEYEYKGNIYKDTGKDSTGIYNVTDNNLLDIINGAILYSGVADFDKEGKLIEYAKIK